MKNQGTEVVIIGPTPIWKQDLARIVYKYWKNNQSLPPEYLEGETDVNAVNVKMDQQFKQLSINAGANYFSAYDLLCKENSCLTRVPDSNNALPMLDEDHITPIAAIYIAKNFYSSTLKELLSSDNIVDSNRNKLKN
jgi:hypothetical protein